MNSLPGYIYETKIIIFTLHFLERALEKVTKNANYCLETMVNDFEGMQSLDDFVHVTPVKRKRKAGPPEKPKKKKKAKLALKPPPIKQTIVLGRG